MPRTDINRSTSVNFLELKYSDQPPADFDPPIEVKLPVMLEASQSKEIEDEEDLLLKIEAHEREYA